MDVGHPYLALLPRVWGATLQALNRTVAPMTGREVARRAGVSHPAALEALDHFVEHGLVRLQPAGRANLYSYNEEHLAASAVGKIFDLRGALVASMKESLKHWEFKPDHVSLFGSLARGDGDTKSDIDVLVVRPELRDDSEYFVWHGQVDTLAQAIYQWTGNRAALVEVSRPELETMQRQNHRLLLDARRDGILVWGDSLERVHIAKLRSSKQPSVVR